MKHFSERLGLGISIFTLASALYSNALAQATTEDANEIVVTGTAIRGVAPTGSATVNVGRLQLIDSGVRDPSSVIAELPQGSRLGSTLQNNTGRNAGVNLRGLGNNATLLLFDGHRAAPQGVTSQIADPNTIPFAAIERVEVVTDGASAIYGSDAVAGVVNYILRKPYDGAEISARYQNSVYQQYGLDISGGKTWTNGGILVALGYERNGHAVREAVSPRLMQDQSPFGGNDARFVGTSVVPGANGALVVGTTVYGLPANLKGRVPTAAEVLALRGNPQLYDLGSYLDYFSQRERISGVVRMNQDFGRAGETTLTVLFNNRRNEAPGGGDGGFTNVGVPVTSTSPYFITGLPSGTARQTVVYNFRLNNPGRDLDQTNTENTFNVYLDHKVDLFGDFQLTASGVYGNNFGCAVCQPQGNTFLAGVISQPQYAARFNPFAQGPQASAEGIFGAFVQKASNQIGDIVLKADGSLFELPAGAVRLATGYEFQRLDFRMRALNTLNIDTSYQTSRFASRHRIINSAFAELFIPLFGPNNAMPLLQRLDLSAAVRHDDYSDVGNTTNPKVGVSWEPHNDFLVRASWGTSFRAATLGESDSRTVGQTNRTNISNGLNNPLIPVTNVSTGQSLVLNRGGNTAGLAPESAEIFSVGTDYTPSFLDGLKVSLTYYNVNYKDRIENLPNATNILSSQAAYDQYKDFFIIAPQPSTCVNGNPPGLPGTAQYSTYNPLYLPWLNNPDAVYSPSTANDCQLVGIITGGRRNLGRVLQSGLDVSASYQFDTPLGNANLGGSFSKILDLKRSLLPNSPLFDALDTIGNQVSERGRLSASLTNGPWSGNVSMNYVGSYLNNATITVGGVKYPDTQIPSWTTIDAGLTWRAPAETGHLAGVRAAINVRNVGDKAPPIVLSGTSSVDLNNHSIAGRYWQFELSKRF